MPINDMDALFSCADMLHSLKESVEKVNPADFTEEVYGLYNDIAKEAAVFIKAMLDFNANNPTLSQADFAISPEWIKKWCK